MQRNNLLTLTFTPRIARNILIPEKPKCQSAINTITAIPPPTHTFTSQEENLLRDLNKNTFRIVTPIKTDMLEKLTMKHLNRPYVNYVINGLHQGFRYGYTNTRHTTMQNNLKSIYLDIMAFEKAI